MKSTSYSVLFFIKRTKLLKDGKAPIFVRISVNNGRAEFSLNRSIDVKQWNADKGRATGHNESVKALNDFIENVSSKLYEIKRKKEEFHTLYSAQDLINEYFGIDKTCVTIGNVFEEHNARVKELIGKDYAAGTHERYETCFKLFKEFLKKKYRKDDVRFDEINSEMIQRFELYLKTVRNCCNNTTVKYIKNFRKIIRIALTKGMKVDPFIGLKFRLDEVDIDYLDESELERMRNKTFKIERLENVKNVYLFCCYTGLAFIDVKEMNVENISIDENGNKWIFKKRSKTGRLCRIPLLPSAVSILNKYKDYQRYNKGRALPVLSNQKMNSYIREIADMCEINKKLTTHTARHTFATTVTLSNNVPMEVVSKMLGHSTIKMTEKYAHVIKNYIDKSMNPLREKYQ